MESLLALGLALAIGLLIGVERGWQQRAAQEGSRMAGVRTFGLIGLLGGLWGLLAEAVGELLLGLAFAGLAGLLIVAHLRLRPQDRGITTDIAGLVTFALGALAVRDYQLVAAAAAVVTALLLSLKPVLHRWLERLSSEELGAILKLLLISVVLLPTLPNRGFGPWNALNPYEIWWMVVLIAGISFAGYFAMRIAGTRRGILLTGLFGGLASSTATTLNLARLGQQRKRLHRILVVAVLVAGTTMFPRMLLEVAVINPALLAPLLVPMAAMTAAACAGAAWLWYQERRNPQPQETLPYRNPFEIVPALQFGLLLALVMFLGRALNAWLGEAGLYLLAAGSGLADVDAITLSLARMAQEEVSATVAVRAMTLAAMVNTLVKTGLVFAIAGATMGWRLVPVIAAVLAAGGAALLWLP